jgi:hypothetical protein
MMCIPSYLWRLFTPEWLTAIGTVGAVVLALVLALWGQWIGQLFFRPVLVLAARVQLPDTTKVRRHVQLSDGRLIDLGEYYYFRLAITNEGNTAARDVQLFLAEVQRVEGEKIDIVSRFTPMNLIWTNTQQLPAKDRVTRSVLLAHTPPLYCDLAHVGEPQRRKQPGEEDLDNVPPDKAVLGLDVEVPTYSKGHLLEPGIYHFTLTLAASNCRSTDHLVWVSFPGDWFPEVDEMLAKGFKMEKLKPPTV